MSTAIFPLAEDLSGPSRPIWIDFGFAKAAPASANDPWLIYITASSPRIDLQGEQVLPVAIQDGARYFLNRGIITYEHMTNANRHDPSIIIGRPLDLRFGGGTVALVKARLYERQPKAQYVMNILQSGGQMGSSIGGDVLERSLAPNGTPIISKIWLNHIALTPWPVNDDCQVQLTPYAEFMAKALASGSAAPLVQQDLEGARERGTPAFAQRWKALTDILQQQYPTLTKEEAKTVAHALLTRRGADRPAYVSTPPGAYRH